MIVVKMEMWPGGDEVRARPIATAVIFNDATGNSVIGNYQYVIGRKGKYDPRSLLSGRHVLRQGRITGFNRKARKAWELVMLCLAAGLHDS